MKNLTCTKCHQDKPEDDFPKDRSRKNRNGRACWCRACYARWYEGCKDEHKIRTYRKKIKHRYGMELETYIELMAQGCSVCGSHERMVMDHCHATNSNRAPLCNNCNVALGQVHDDPVRLEALATYLRQHQTVSAAA